MADREASIAPRPHPAALPLEIVTLNVFVLLSTPLQKFANVGTRACCRGLA